MTLSPVPGFMQWVKQDKDLPLSDEDREILKRLDAPKWFENPETTAQLRGVLEPLAAYYFLKAPHAEGPADRSRRALPPRQRREARAHQLARRPLAQGRARDPPASMVNYLYRLDDIEKNHEAYANDGEVVASSAVKKLLKSEGRRLLDMRLS